MDSDEKIIFHYEGKNKYACKSITTKVLPRAFSKPIEWKFQEKPVNWHQIETIYDTDQVFPLIKTSIGKFDIEQNFDVSKI